MKPLFAPTLAALAFALGGCAFMAVRTAPAKLPSASRTALAQQADAVFWRTLHGGRYDGIGAALEIQTAAYLGNPNDAVTAARAGWLHIFRLAESSRLGRRRTGSSGTGIASCSCRPSPSMPRCSGSPPAGSRGWRCRWTRCRGSSTYRRSMRS